MLGYDIKYILYFQRILNCMRNYITLLWISTRFVRVAQKLDQTWLKRIEWPGNGRIKTGFDCAKHDWCFSHKFKWGYPITAKWRVPIIPISPVFAMYFLFWTSDNFSWSRLNSRIIYLNNGWFFAFEYIHIHSTNFRLLRYFTVKTHISISEKKICKLFSHCSQLVDVE